MARIKKGSISSRVHETSYQDVLMDVVRVIESSRQAAVRAVNSLMTITYWSVGRLIVENEQAGAARANYGEELLVRLSHDLQQRFGRGFGRANLFQMRAFYLAYREKIQTASGISSGPRDAPFLLPWSHYAQLLSVHNVEAREFYEAEALRGGWTVRQLARQINSQFYERTLLSKNKAAMLRRGMVAEDEDAVTPEEEIKEPYLLEFLDLKDEYSETDLEAGLIGKLEEFLLELGGDFTFVGRQRRLRVGSEWYRLDLLFFHRRLRSLVIIDLKLGRLTHADAGQMHLYLNYAREHWMLPGENPPVGLILCAEKDSAIARYALEGLPNKVVAAEYRTALPAEKMLAEQIKRTRRQLETGLKSELTPKRGALKR